jgi:rhodanese-related sulfurtransferase
VAVSVLERNGFTRVRNVPGGMAAWEAAGMPTD